MPTSVIKLLNPPNIRVERSLTERITGSLLQAAFWWVPKASPDYDKRLVEVAYWLIEVDDDTGRAEREIGFDTFNNPILCAPTHQNLGMWTDSERLFTKTEHEVIEAQKFDLLWGHCKAKRATNTSTAT